MGLKKNHGSEEESTMIYSTQQLVDYYDRMWYDSGGEHPSPPLIVTQKQYDRLAACGFPIERMQVYVEIPISTSHTDCDPHFYYVSTEFIHQYQGNNVLLMGNISHVNLNVCQSHP